MVRRVIFFCAALATALLLHIRADACTVLAPHAPPPLPLDLPANATSVIISDAGDGKFPADELYVQLVLIGIPPDGMGRTICGLPPLVHGDPFGQNGLHDITEQQLHSFTQNLISGGIPASDITSALATPAPSPWSHKSLPVKVGEVMVAVHPVNAVHLAVLLTRIASIWSGKEPAPSCLLCNGIASLHWQWHSALQFAGLVVRQRTCTDHARVLAQTRAKALQDARAFAALFGLDARDAVTDGFEEHPAGGESIMVCGSERATLPYFPQPGVLDDALGFKDMPVPQYHAHYFGRAVFAVSGMPAQSDPAIANLRQWGVVPLDPDDEKFPSGLRLPPHQPFVSTFGSYRAVVKADALMLHVWSYNPPSFPDAAHDTKQALLRIGMPPRDILVRHGILFARISPLSNDWLTRIHDALADVSGVSYGLTPFVRDCSILPSQVEQSALHQALLRAQAMAGAAHASVGGLLAVSQGVNTSDAACGANEHSSIAQLVALQPPDTVFDAIGDDHFDTSAEFIASIAAAWKLDSAAPDTSTVPYAYPGYVFLPEHGGALGIGNTTFVAAKPEDCAAPQLSLLADAVRDGMRQNNASHVFALVDQSIVYPNEQYWHCLPDREGSGGGGQVAMRAQVTVVP